MRPRIDAVRHNDAVGLAHVLSYRLAATHDREEDGEDAEDSGRTTAAGEDLSYKIELWDAAKASVEQVLAVTVSGSIGFAAYYAATREYPDRYVTLRHRSSVLSRWNGPEQ